MRTDEQRRSDALEAIEKLNVDQLREYVFISSVLIEMMVKDMAHPVLDESMHKKWIDAAWILLHEIRTEEHMAEVVQDLKKFNAYLQLSITEGMTVQ